MQFKRVDAKKPIKIDNVLPKPNGPLSSVMPMSSIELANVAVKRVMLTASCVTAEDDEIDDKHHGTYQHFTSKEKLELGKRAAELGISSTVRYFTTKSGEERTLSLSTLFAWKEKYLRNRVPTRSLKKTTPYERWYGRKPDLSHIKVFGCMCYAYIPDTNRKGKLSKKLRNYVCFIGYSLKTKGYRLIDEGTSKVLVH